MSHSSNISLRIHLHCPYALLGDKPSTNCIFCLNYSRTQNEVIDSLHTNLSVTIEQLFFYSLIEFMCPTSSRRSTRLYYKGIIGVLSDESKVSLTSSCCKGKMSCIFFIQETFWAISFHKESFRIFPCVSQCSSMFLCNGMLIFVLNYLKI